MPDLKMMDKNHPVAMAGESKSKNKKRWPWVVVGILIILIFVVLGAYLGYQDGIKQRLALQASKITELASTQFDYGVIDLQAGRLQNAQTRFEYVINLDPSFPGATQKLAEVLTALNLTRTPTDGPKETATPTIEVTPTPDTRGAEDLFNEAKQAITQKKYTDAINNLDALRTLDVTYRTVDTDDLYFFALRNRGIQRITINGLLEQGLYDLSLAERFGPLDSEAESYRTYARLYLDGAAYWEINWKIVLSYFSQIYTALPALRDASGITASERFRIASQKYGDQLSSANEFCQAATQYAAALPMSQDSNFQSTVVSAKDKCAGPTNTPVPQTTATQAMVSTTAVKATLSGTAPAQQTTAPTETPTTKPPEITSTPTPNPTETPTTKP